MHIKNYILALIFFGIIITFGYVFARRLLREKFLIYLIPFPVCFGISFYTVVLHLLSLLFSVKNATYITLVLTFSLIPLIFFLTKSNKEYEIGLSKVKLLSLCLISLITGLLTFSYLLRFDTYDPGLYQLIGLMTNESHYPPKNQFGNEIYLVYHSGVALFASSLKVFSELDTLQSLLPIQFLFISILPFILFGLIYSCTKSYLQAFIGTLICLFCANLKAFNLLSIVGAENTNNFIGTLDEKIFWVADSSFVSPTQKALMSPNTSIAFALGAFLFFLSTKDFPHKLIAFTSILFVSSYLFFSYEAYWLPIAFVICLFQLFKILRNKLLKEKLVQPLLIIIIILVSPILTGSVFQNKNENITKLVSFDLKHFTYSFSRIIDPIFKPTKEDEVICNANGNIFYKLPILSWHFFNEFGLPLLALPLVLWWLYKRKNQVLFFYLLCGITAFIIPFLITYTIIEIETHRFLVLSRFIFSLLFGTFLGSLFEVKFQKAALTIISKTLLTVLILLLFLPSTYWLLPIKHNFEYRATILSKADKAALSWLSKHSGSGDVGIGPWDIPFRCFELISIAGVYGSGVHIQNIAQELTRTTALTTLDPCLLSELKIKWLYLNKNLDDFASALIPQDITCLLDIVPKDKLNKLIEDKVIAKKYTYKDKSELRIIYEVNSLLIKNYCKDKNYVWALGRMQQGNFIPIKSSSIKTTFENKKAALKYLREFKKSLPQKDAIWYGVEAISI